MVQYGSCQAREMASENTYTLQLVRYIQICPKTMELLEWQVNGSTSVSVRVSSNRPLSILI